MSLKSWFKKVLGVDKIEESIDTTILKISKILKDIESLNEEISKIPICDKTETNPEINESLSNIKTDVDKLHESINSLEKKLDILDGEFTGLRNLNYLVGFVDEDHNIYIHTEGLKSGTYSVKYLGKDGKSLRMYDTIIKFNIQ